MWDAVSGGNPLQNTVVEQQAGGMKTNRIASMNGTAFSYDASGNVTGDGARAYTYDAENRSVIVSLSGLGSESYGYAAGNRRVKKEVEGVVTHYVWEGDQVIAEYEYGGGNSSATGTRYYHQDRLSTRLITDGSGNVVGTADHLPFGEDAGGIGESEKHKFTTYERDGTGLDYAVNRHYGPQQGRFNQADPLGLGASSLADPQTLNLYAYVANDPVNMVDPLGLEIVHSPSGPPWKIICGLVQIGWDSNEQPVYVLDCGFVRTAFLDMGRVPTNVIEPPKEPEKTDPAPQEPPCELRGGDDSIVFSAANGFSAPLGPGGQYSTAELMDATTTVFGEISSRVSDTLFVEALAVASEIFNRSDAIRNGTQGNNPFGNSPSLTDVVSAGRGVQFAGFAHGKRTLQSGVELSQGERNCIRLLTAAKAVILASLPPILGPRMPFLFNRSNNGGRRRLQPGQVRIGGNDFSVSPM